MKFEVITLDNKVTEYIKYGILGDTYVYANETPIQINDVFVDINGNEKKTSEIKYRYDVYHVGNENKTEEDVINTLKKIKIDEILSFNESEYSDFGDEAIKDFTLNGNHMWINTKTRLSLSLRFKSENSLRSVNGNKTTFWYGMKNYTFDLDFAQQLLSKIELYASKCFDKTNENIDKVNNFKTIDEIVKFDYKSTYPKKLNFTI